MTNKSNRHIKIHSNQTMGMLWSCEDGQICSIGEIVSFDRCPKVGRDDTSGLDTTKWNLYYIPTRNLKTGRLEVTTLPRKDLCPHVQVNEVGPQQDYVHYRKPNLLDGQAIKETKQDLERLLEVNHDAFAEEWDVQVQTTPLIKMSIDTSKHPPVAKKPYALGPKTAWLSQGWDQQDYLRQELFEKATPVGQHELWWYPKAMVARGYA